MPSGPSDQLPANGQETAGAGDTDIVCLLKFMMAEAHTQQDRVTAAQLHETLRCVSVFDQVLNIK